MKQISEQKKTLGLALGSGSARGASHIGVIKALLEEGIEIHYISGSSIGAIVAAFYGFDQLKYFEEFLLQINWKIILSYLDFTFPKSGLLDGNKIYHLLYNAIKDKKIEESRIPLSIIATGLESGEEISFRSGSVVDAVRASISIPGIFTPYQLNDQFLIDGGVVNPLPVNAVRDLGADIVIAVDLNQGSSNVKNQLKSKKAIDKSLQITEKEKKDVEFDLLQELQNHYSQLEISIRERLDQFFNDRSSNPSIFDVIGNYIQITQNRITKINLQLYKPEILIQPELGELGLFDYDDSEMAIAEGYKKTQEQMERIKELLFV